MSDFKAKMHQIRFPQTPLGELTYHVSPEFHTDLRLCVYNNI